MKPWLVLRNTPLEGPGLLADALEAERISSDVIDGGEDVMSLGPGGGIEDVGGLVILGGPMGVYEEDRYPWLGVERRIARLAVERGLPVLGICLGAQLLASAFGARVHPGPTKEIGWAPLMLTREGLDDPVLEPLARASAVFHLHGDTFDLPAGAIHLARSAVYPLQAFRIGRRAYGLQFHLEFTLATVQAVLGDPACRADLLDLGRDPGAIAAGSAEKIHALEPVAREVLRRFIRL